MKYPLVFYVKKLPDGFGGKANGPVIRILREYKGNRGLLAHELVHVKQWFITCGLHSILYKFSKTYRLRCEVKAYREQLKYSPTKLGTFAWFIAHIYNLDVTVSQAMEMLK